MSNIRFSISEIFPEAVPESELRHDNQPDYLLWMLDRVQEMDEDDISAALKAARWVGWILRVVEAELSLWENSQSRDLVRLDVIGGFDLPLSMRNIKKGGD